MKKATLSELISFNDIRSLSSKRLHSLKGGCSSDYPTPPPTCVIDNPDEGEENNCNGGGGEDFIPPPGT